MYDLCGMMDTFDFQYNTQIYASLAIENAILLMNIPLCATLHQLGTIFIHAICSRRKLERYNSM